MKQRATQNSEHAQIEKSEDKNQEEKTRSWVMLEPAGHSTRYRNYFDIHPSPGTCLHGFNVQLYKLC